MKTDTVFKAIAFFAAVGFAISIYMTLAHYDSASICAAAVGNSCDAVNKSRFSEIFGMPIPVIGIGGYLALFLTSIVKIKNNQLFKDLNFYIFLMALVGFGFTVYLNYLEFFELKTICYICTVSALCITFIFMLSIIGLNRE